MMEKVWEREREGEREGERERQTNGGAGRGKLIFAAVVFGVVLQLVMNDRQGALSWRRAANGIVARQP